AVAHHSAVMFDDAKEITVTGTVKEFQYTNPHSWLLVDVKGADGKVTTWGFEAEGPSTLTRAGIGKSDLSPGTEVTISGHPMPVGMPWSAQADDWAQSKAALQAVGEQFDSSSALYRKLKADAGGGKPLTWAQLGAPAYNWSGIYTRTKGALQFDPDLPMTAGPASAQLTPEGQKVVDAKLAHLKATGGEYDPISDCRPPGTPRWF